MSASTEPRALINNLHDLMCACPNSQMLAELCRIKAVGVLHGGQEAFVRRLLRLQAKAVRHTLKSTPIFSDDEVGAGDADDSDTSDDALAPADTADRATDTANEDNEPVEANEANEPAEDKKNV